MNQLKPSSPVRRKPAPLPLRFLATVLALGVALAVNAWALDCAWRSALEAAEQRASNILLAVQDSVANAINGFDKDMQAAIHGLAVPGLASMDLQTQQAILFNHIDKSEGQEGIIITDEAGQLRYWSSNLTNPPRNVANRPQFMAQQASDGLGLVFSNPTQGLMDGKWIIAFSRRINHPDGSFAGVALGRVLLHSFEQSFSRFDVGPNGVISFINTSGVLISRFPIRGAFIGADLSNTPLLRALAAAPSGVVDSVAKTDGVRRLLSYSKVAGLPFVVAVGMPMRDIFIQWLRSSAWLFLALAGLVVIGLSMVWRLWREYSRRGVAETEAKHGEQRLQSLLDNADSHAIYLLDATGHVVGWNSGAERIKGYTQAEIIGRNLEVFFTPEDRASGEPARVLAAAAEHGHYQDEALRLRKDGRCFQAWIAITAIRDSTGVLQGYSKVTHDLSARLVEEEQRAIMIEATDTGMLVVNEDGIITQTNSSAEQIFGYARGTLAGRPMDVLVPPDQLSSTAFIRAELVQHTTRGMSLTREFIRQRRDGSRIMVEATLQPVRTARGDIVVFSITDSTERMRREQERVAAEAQERMAVEQANARLERLSTHLAQSRDEANRANEAKTRFLTGITHELRTPLNGILGYAQLLSAEGGLNDVQAARVRSMQEAGEHLLGMINAVLDLSEIEADRIEMHFEPVDLPSLLRACLALVRPAAQAKQIELTLSLHPAVQTNMNTDRTRLRQVLVNLLGNAVKFTKSGSVELRLLPGAASTDVRLEVADTGPGITPEHRQRLFQEFDRLNAVAAGMEAGSGLGLAISSRLVHRLTGTMGYADNPGGGSLFWIELPSGAARMEQSAAQSAAEASVPQQSLRILVVDDVAMNRDVATAFLQLAGHEVACVEDGLAAVEAVTQGGFDVVLMDVRMPGIDGLEATRRIRALPGQEAGVPIIAMTAQAFSEQIEQCMAAGMSLHVAKPFQQNTLLAAIATAVAKPGANRKTSTALAAASHAELPVLDESIYHTTAGFLQPADMQRHLSALLDGSKELVTRLRATNLLATLLDSAEAAHALAGAAGSLGFYRLAAAAKSFEHSAEADEADLAERAESLTDATDASIAVMQRLIQAALVTT